MPPIDPPDPLHTVWFYFEYPTSPSSSPVRIMADAPPTGYRAFVSPPGSSKWTELTSSYDETILLEGETFRFAADKSSSGGPASDAIIFEMKRTGKTEMEATVIPGAGALGVAIDRPNGDTKWGSLTSPRDYSNIEGTPVEDHSLSTGWQFP